MRTRKPNWKDKAKGCRDFFLEIMAGVFELNVDRIVFSHYMFWETLKGNFRVVEDEKDESTNC